MLHFDLPSLNSAQETAVRNMEGISLIIAGAGTGKTHTLISKVISVLNSGADPRSMMLLTFTNKAASEMTRRVEEYLSRPVHGLLAGTFHSVALRLLRIYGAEIGCPSEFTIIDTDDAEALMGNICRDYHFSEKKKFPKKSLLYSMQSYMRNKDLSLEELMLTKYKFWLECENEIGRVFKRYVEIKKMGKMFDFDDLLEGFLKLLKNKNTGDKIRGRYKWVFVDEYQDTNKIQNQVILNLLSPATNLTVVGDDAQSIYSFRGACFQNIIKFPDNFPETHIYKLETNYRSSQAILEYSNAVIRNNKAQFKKNLVSGIKDEGILPKIYKFNTDAEQAYGIAELIKKKLSEGVKPSEIAVFYRAHMLSLSLQLSFSRLGIPYIITSGIGFFEQAHVKDMVCHLKILHNPSDVAAWNRVLLMIPAVGQQTALKIINNIPLNSDLREILESVYSFLPSKGKDAWKNLYNILRGYAGEKDFAPSGLITLILENEYFCSHLYSSFENPENRLEDLKYLAKFSDTYKDLQSFLSEIVLMTSQDDKRKNSGKNITLTTVHQAKGLEWGHVFIIWMAEGYFPSYQCLNSEEEIEEERRLYYVACTRARKELTMTFPSIDEKARNGSLYLKPSRFLTEVDRSLFTFRDLTVEI